MPTGLCVYGGGGGEVRTVGFSLHQWETAPTVVVLSTLWLSLWVCGWTCVHSSHSDLLLRWKDKVGTSCFSPLPCVCTWVRALGCVYTYVLMCHTLD